MCLNIFEAQSGYCLGVLFSHDAVVPWRPAVKVLRCLLMLLMVVSAFIVCIDNTDSSMAANG
jgi:hypothetical protein